MVARSVGKPVYLPEPAARRPLGHRAVDYVKDEGAHEGDGGTRMLASQRQRDCQNACHKPGECEQIGGVGEVGQDGGRRWRGIA